MAAAPTSADALPFVLLLPAPMFTRLATMCSASLALVVLCGCQPTTLASRIDEKQSLFSRLPPRQQELIRRGLITTGFTREMVYIVLAKPDRIVPGPGPQQETWIYETFYAADGSTQMPTKVVAREGVSWGSAPGGPPGPIYGKAPLTYSVEYDPGSPRASIPSSRRVQVIFNFGRVAAIQISES